MIKKNHKTKHNRFVGKLWSTILLSQCCERLKDYDVVIENAELLFIKKGE